jgi:Spy/CpxP family protein refolding chaperone
MKKKILILTMAAALGVGGLFVWNANAQFDGVRRGPGALLQRVKAKLGITDAQAVQIRSILKENRETLAKLSHAIHDSHSKLRDTIQNDASTEADVRAASAQLAKAQADMAVERHKLFGKIKPILTAEQLSKMVEMQDRIDSFVDGAIDTFEQKLAQ